MAGIWLCESCAHKEDDRYVCGSIAMDGICARCSGLARMVFMPECQDPRPGDYRPSVFTTSQDLVRYAQIVWDVNCYYLDLGVRTDATRLQIRRAYERWRGWESPRLTYIVKQLLNPEIRAAYDACRPGWLFFDEYVLASTNRRIQDDLARHFADGGTMEQTEKIDFSHLVGKPFQVVDRPPSGEQDEVPSWGWGYYLWQSGCRDERRLAQWQEHLVRVLAERKEHTHLAVGFLGKHMACPWEVTTVGNRLVAFLSDDQQPTADLANQAADRVETHTRANALVTSL